MKQEIKSKITPVPEGYCCKQWLLVALFPNVLYSYIKLDLWLSTKTREQEIHICYIHVFVLIDLEGWIWIWDLSKPKELCQCEGRVGESLIIFAIFSVNAGFHSSLRRKNLSLPTLGRDEELQTRVLPSVKAMTAWLLLCGGALLPTRESSGLMPPVSSDIYTKYSCLPKVLRSIHNKSQIHCVYSWGNHKTWWMFLQ